MEAEELRDWTEEFTAFYARFASLFGLVNCVSRRPGVCGACYPAGWGARTSGRGGGRWHVGIA